ncbi:hypothetical protein K474DRAFT_1366186 [Panus rudis PR-1116 ss-1]|nr:hypothetical protein K474DRAFT_1366186 [Panus rudis PR-1116 ss-1]
MMVPPCSYCLVCLVVTTRTPVSLQVLPHHSDNSSEYLPNALLRESAYLKFHRLIMPRGSLRTSFPSTNFRYLLYLLSSVLLFTNPRFCYSGYI